MRYEIKNNRVSYLEDSIERGYALFPFFDAEQTIVQISSTVVDPALRGQGIAGHLMEEVVQYALDHNVKIYPTCSYAVDWFEKYPEHSSLVSLPTSDK